MPQTVQVLCIKFVQLAMIHVGEHDDQAKYKDCEIFIFRSKCHTFQSSVHTSDVIFF